MAERGEDETAISAGERAAIEVELRRRDLPPRVRERLEMVKAAALGQDLVRSRPGAAGRCARSAAG